MGLKQDLVAEKSIAVVGVSRTRGFGNIAFNTLRSRGYKVFAVNPKADSIEGDKCFASLDALPEKVGLVLTVVPPEQTEKVVADCARLGIGRVWMQQGSESDAAIALCKEKGIAEVHDACILMYAQPSGIHRFHGFLWKLLGKS